MKMDIIQMAAIGVIDLLKDHHAFEKYAAVCKVEYQPDPTKPLKVLDIRKVAIPEFEKQYPNDFSELGQRREDLSQTDQRLGGDHRTGGRRNGLELRSSEHVYSSIGLHKDCTILSLPSLLGWSDRRVERDFKLGLSDLCNER